MAKQMTKDEVKAYTTNRIVEALKGGKIPWERPWNGGAHRGMAHNFVTNKRYNGGINQILLMLSASMNGWSDNRWVGRGQALKAGHNIKGLTNVKGTIIFLPIIAKYTNDEGDRISYCKGFRQGIVFNAAQIQDLAPIEGEEKEEIDPAVGWENAAEVLKLSGATVHHGGSRAYYSPKTDHIQMPEAADFKSIAGYWSTLMHELTHWTGADSRLKRECFGKGKRAYAYEELVAEMGSAFLCAWLGVDKPAVTTNHEAYIQSWIQALDNNHSIFMDATVQAWAAFQLLAKE